MTWFCCTDKTFATLVEKHWFISSWPASVRFLDRQRSKVVEGIDSGARLREVESWLRYLPSVWLSESHLTSLGLSIFVYKMRIIIDYIMWELSELMYAKNLNTAWYPSAAEMLATDLCLAMIVINGLNTLTAILLLLHSHLLTQVPNFFLSLY